MKIHNGNNIDILKTYPDNHFDSIVTDPPYGIEFLGKDWDKNTGAVETWQECLRVLKPGGYLLAFSAARTYHNLASNIESVGFEIRDQLMWLYSSGFPKAQDIGRSIQRRLGVEQTKPQDGMNAYANQKPLMERMSFANLKAEDYPPKNGETVCTSPEAKQWEGWKTALKPAHEPIVMARKPFKGSTIDNVLTHGVGALNIDATRIETNKLPPAQINGGTNVDGFDIYNNKKDTDYTPNEQGRYPSNVLGEVEGYQKFFYCPKVSRAERHCGFEQTAIPSDPAGMFDHGPSYMQHKDSLSHIVTKDDTNGGNFYSTTTHPTDPKLQNKYDHIDKPFSDVKGCYVDGKRFAEHHQTLQEPVVTFVQMLEQMGGHETEGGGIWLPHCGEIKAHGVSKEYAIWLKMNNKTANVGNNHPTVKPVELMKWLIQLVTPANGKVLDPFTGSGSTGMAAVELNYDFTGCELDPKYVEIATKRIRGWSAYLKLKETEQYADNNFNALFEYD